MNCSNCGIQNNNGEVFCKNCGCRLNNVINNQSQANVTQQPIQNQNMDMNNNVQQPMMQQQNTMNGGLNQNYIDNAVNPDMKKWAILSVIMPILAFIWSFLFGMYIYIAVLIATTGFEFAIKGSKYNKNLALVGKILNITFVVSIVIIYYIQTIS